MATSPTPEAMMPSLDVLLDEISTRTAERAAALIAEQLARAQPADAPAQERLLTIRETADRLRVSLSTVYELRRSGRLVPVYVGRAVRFRASDVTALAQTGTSNPA